MSPFGRDVGLKVAGYKAFGSDPQGFDRTLPVNVVIGRNNSGKSSLIDLVEWMATEVTSDKPTPPLVGRQGGRAEVWQTLPYPILLPGHVPGRPAKEHLRHPYHSPRAWEEWKAKLSPQTWPNVKEFWDDVVVRWKYGVPDSAEVVSLHPTEVRSQTDLSETTRQFLKNARPQRGQGSPDFPYKRRGVFRLLAERSVSAEPLDTGALHLGSDGRGLSNLLNRFINDRGLDRRVVEVELLDALNTVFEPDATFVSIQIQRQEDNTHEVFVEEASKGAIPLSASGSGIQTVLLVLASLYVLPQAPGNPSDLSEWLFAFEELENNLHPALQRRLFWLLRDRAVADGALVFVTTHSPVVVDLFADDEHAQIVHVTHDGTEATATPVLTHTSRRGILDDLDVRASDLLQANAVVWVEGPTDRMYFNRWLQLWTDGDLREGKDYQCVFYGGRLLNHLSAEEPEDRQREAVEILRVNRNAVVLIDSDKRYNTAPINDSKKRLRDEVEAGGGVAWVTKGREVEQYVPNSVFRRHFGPDTPELERFGEVLDYLNGVEGKSGRKRYDKIRLAEHLIPLMTRDDLEGHLDLAERLSAVVAKIMAWNRRPAPAPREIEG